MSGGGSAGMGSPMGGQPSMGGGFGQPSMGSGFGPNVNNFGGPSMGGGFGPNVNNFGQPSMGGGFGQPQNPFGNQMGGYGRQMGGFGGGYGGGFGQPMGGYGGGFGQPMGGYGSPFGGGFGSPFGGGFGSPFGGQPQLQLSHGLPPSNQPPAWQQSDDWKGLMSQREALEKQMGDYARQYQPQVQQPQAQNWADEDVGAGRFNANPSVSGRDLLSMLQGAAQPQQGGSQNQYTAYAFSEGGLAGLAKGKK